MRKQWNQDGNLGRTTATRKNGRSFLKKNPFIVKDMAKKGEVMKSRKDEQIENDSAVMFAKLCNIATNKKDGRNHDVYVVMSEWTEQRTSGSGIRHRFLSGVVDETRELGVKLGVGEQTVMHKCVVFAPKGK